MIAYILCPPGVCKIWALCVSWITYDLLYYALCLACCTLYVLVMSRTRFRVKLHSIVAWMSRNSLLETGAVSEVKNQKLLCTFIGMRMFPTMHHREFPYVQGNNLTITLRVFINCCTLINILLTKLWLYHTYTHIHALSHLHTLIQSHTQIT